MTRRPRDALRNFPDAEGPTILTIRTEREAMTMKQRSLAETGYERRPKATKRQRFLSEMDTQKVIHRVEHERARSSKRRN
jgi:hypothetical protein